jgi:hypothetical protein
VRLEGSELWMEEKGIFFFFLPRAMKLKTAVRKSGGSKNGLTTARLTARRLKLATPHGD